jgi:holin-like protein
MLGALVLLLGCQLAGEAAARAIALPVPGPVLGMALLFGLLALRGWLRPTAPAIEHTALGTVAAALLANLSLLFVPAGTGVVQQGPVLLHNGLGLLVALLVSTALTLAVTGWVFMAVARRVRR